MLRRLAAVLVAWVIFGLCVWASIVISKPAKARDLDGRYSNSPHTEWFKSQHNSLGEWCCSDADGHRYYGDYSVNTDGSVTVEGEIIPKGKVLTGPNPTGAAVWWFLETAAGKRTYCFAVGGGV